MTAKSNGTHASKQNGLRGKASTHSSHMKERNIPIVGGGDGRNRRANGIINLLNKRKETIEEWATQTASGQGP
eukprot:5404567-Amphidinium_carterae.1